MPPTIDAVNAAERNRWTSGRVKTVRRSMGASIRWRTSAASIESGPPSLPLRRPSATASTATIPSTAGPSPNTDAICDGVASASPTWSLSTITALPPKIAAM